MESRDVISNSSGWELGKLPTHGLSVIDNVNDRWILGKRSVFTVGNARRKGMWEWGDQHLQNVNSSALYKCSQFSRCLCKLFILSLHSWHVYFFNIGLGTIIYDWLDKLWKCNTVHKLNLAVKCAWKRKKVQLLFPLKQNKQTDLSRQTTLELQKRRYRLEHRSLPGVAPQTKSEIGDPDL